MNTMNDLLGGYLNKFVLVFLDNVLTYSANPQDHADHLRKVLEKLKEHQLFVKASKCEILKTSVEFLGQQICKGGMTPDRGEIEGRPRLGYPIRRKRSTILLGVRELLPTFCEGFCTNRGLPNVINKEGRGVAMEALTTACLSTFKGIIVLYTSFVVPRP